MLHLPQRLQGTRSPPDAARVPPCVPCAVYRRLASTPRLMPHVQDFAINNAQPDSPFHAALRAYSSRAPSSSISSRFILIIPQRGNPKRTPTFWLYRGSEILYSTIASIGLEEISVIDAATIVLDRVTEYGKKSPFQYWLSWNIMSEPFCKFSFCKMVKWSSMYLYGIQF